MTNQQFSADVLDTTANHLPDLATAAGALKHRRDSGKVIDWRTWRKAHANRLLFTEDEMLNYPKPPVFVDNLLLAGTLAALVSEPGMGKSFIALDLALSAASGQPSFLGLALHVHGPVVYVLGEGAGRFKLRLKAWKHHHGVVDVPLDFHWTNGPINLLDPAEIARFVAELRTLQPALVVIDTLSRCLVGVDENSQQQMTAAVAALDMIRTSVDHLTVLVLHHMNASGSRERGSTVFKGAVDTQLRLRHAKRGSADFPAEDDQPIASKSIKLTVDKQKDIDELTTPIALHKIEITIPDEYEQGGQPSTSLIWTRSDHQMPVADRVLAFVRMNPGASKSTICKSIGGRAVNVQTAIKELEAAQRISVKPQGKEHLVFLTNAA